MQASSNRAVIGDRRAIRRQETINEIVDIAIDLIGQEGAANLSLGAIAKQMGMQTPSLYSYFDSKADLFDEIYTRGWRAMAEHMRPLQDKLEQTDADHLIEDLTECLTGYINWALDNPASAELMFWCNAPGWKPGAEGRRLVKEINASGIETARVIIDAGLMGGEPAEMMALFAIFGTGTITISLTSDEGEGQVGSDYISNTISMLIKNFLIATPPTGAQ